MLSGRQAIKRLFQLRADGLPIWICAPVELPGMLPRKAMNGMPNWRRYDINERPSLLSGWSATSIASRWSKRRRSCAGDWPKALTGKVLLKVSEKNLSIFGASANDHKAPPLKRISAPPSL